MPESLCKFPLFDFGFSLPSFSFELPEIPTFSFSIDLSCPID